MGVIALALGVGEGGGEKTEFDPSHSKMRRLVATRMAPTRNATKRRSCDHCRSGAGGEQGGRDAGGSKRTPANTSATDKI
jgi:hypothetical protein